MAGDSDSRSFRNFLIVWAVAATLAVLVLGMVVVFLLFRSQPESHQSRNSLTTTPAASRVNTPPPPEETGKATAFNALPRGTRIFDGVTFEIGRPINIIGVRAAKAGGREFARVSNQPVTGVGKHIHVLHTGDHGSSPANMFIWRLVLHYADGETRRFDFAYGVHVRNYWWNQGEGDDELSDPDSTITWTGT